MQTQMIGDRLLGIAVLLDRCCDAGMPRVPVAPLACAQEPLQGRARRTARALRHLRAARMPPDLGDQAVRKGASPRRLCARSSRHNDPACRPADTLAIGGLRRGPPGGEVPSFPRPVPWYTAPGYAMRSGRARGLPLPTLGMMCKYNTPDPGFTRAAQRPSGEQMEDELADVGRQLLAAPPHVRRLKVLAQRLGKMPLVPARLDRMLQQFQVVIASCVFMRASGQVLCGRIFPVDRSVTSVDRNVITIAVTYPIQANIERSITERTTHFAIPVVN